MNVPLRIGLALDLGSDPAAGTIAGQLRAAEPVLAAAEQAGLDSVWLGESYHLRPEPFHLPAVLIALARVAPVTRLRLGTGVLLARAWDPDRLAIEAALVDQLSEGRLTLGIGLGGDQLRGVLGGPDRAGGQALDALLARLREVWNEPAPGHWAPAPYQPGGPPLLVGGRGAAAVRRAAGTGDGYYAATNYSDRLLARQVTAYRAAASDAAGRGPGQVAVNRVCLVAADGDRARRLAERHLGPLLHYYRSRGAWDIGRADGDPEPVLVGSPAEVLARLRAYQDLGVTQVQARIVPAGMPPEVVQETLRLLGEQVIPRLGAAGG